MGTLNPDNGMPERSADQIAQEFAAAVQDPMTYSAMGLYLIGERYDNLVAAAKHTSTLPTEPLGISEAWLLVGAIDTANINLAALQAEIDPSDERTAALANLVANILLALGIELDLSGYEKYIASKLG